jgi:hypothetical protein
VEEDFNHIGYWHVEGDDDLDNLLSLIPYEEDYQWDFIYEHMQYQTLIETMIKKHCK